MPVIMLMTYLAIFVFIKISNPFKNIQNSLEAEQARKRFRAERSFLFQGFLICGMLELEDIAFNFLLAPPNTLAQLFLNIFCNWIMITQNLLNPIILFLFNNQIRKATKNVLFWRSSVVGISAVSGNLKIQQIGAKINIQKAQIDGNEQNLFKKNNNRNV
uniref:Uncharacterized protein n=1 Tax=Meloidogyne enterolobii TaxID=390850 RepID=A0A6V7WL95_MELEN|nr:unnamed protein product [Meloidogyne enterolobii]